MHVHEVHSLVMLGRRVGSILVRVGSCDFVDRPCFAVINNQILNTIEVIVERGHNHS